MLHIVLDKKNGIAIFEPEGELTEEDFKKASAVIDPYILQHFKLNGLIIHSKAFPGWDSFSALAKHLRFVKDHHAKISHVAIATDSSIGSFSADIAKHFISAEIKAFKFDQLELAKQWIKS